MRFWKLKFKNYKINWTNVLFSERLSMLLQVQIEPSMWVRAKKGQILSEQLKKIVL